MPRKRVPISNDLSYHINARCINRQWFELPMPTVWSIMEDYLYLIASEYELRIHAFVLMSNHFHLIVTAPHGNLSPAMLYFMRETSREITRLSKRINQTYGQRNHKTLLGSYHYHLNTTKYLYQNPVRAGIVRRAEAYPYSTLHGLCGNSRLIIPVNESLLIDSTARFDDRVLRWINQSIKADSLEEMRLALRKPEFRFAKYRTEGRENPLESELI